MIRTSEDSLLRLIKPNDLKVYLKNNGWVEVKSEQKYLLKFKSPRPINSENKYIHLFISNNEHMVDYKRTVEYALDTVSAFEKRDRDIIINQILILSDCLTARIIGAKKGVMPLNQGISLYEEQFDLITYGACSELGKVSAKRYPRKSNEALRYAESSLMGQSGLGSYVSNIYFPLPRPKDYPWIKDDPFSRKVIVRILRGLNNLSEAEIERTPDPIIDNYSTGLNSNMCDALINILDAGIGKDVIISAILEPIYPIPEDITATKFTLSHLSEHYLKEARDVLIETDPQKEERVFYGYPEILASPQKIERGTIKLKSFDIERGRTITIKIELSPSDYEKALDAHSGKNFIRIKGIPEKIKGRWYLEDPQELEVLEKGSELPWKSLSKFK